ncbi:hypothetical protein L596_029826 [Steinernema carpocapsae]|uniref:Cathepsin propeptide inhibitor domain-containing protein n=1 Tax=Steinernema carpocapsae TaxID=34508 RepID=A0A4U5LQX9_STECR|nr:hypothetical protein L596_029815 [Steinernema carpocapsae]TKR58373.1 hypothetical protein L596_029826 [Steinernema carpocapsae]
MNEAAQKYAYDGFRTRYVLINTLCSNSNAICILSLAEEVHESFELFKQQFGKVYDTPEEEAKRFEIYKAEMDEIDKLNREQNPRATFGINAFSDLTLEEMPGGLESESDTDNDEFIPTPLIQNFSTKYTTKIDEFPEKSKIELIRVWESVKDGEVISEDYSKTTLVLFLAVHLTDNATLQIQDDCSHRNCKRVLPIFCETLLNSKFKDITFLYCKDVSKRFIRAQIAHGGLRSLRLLKVWPSDVIVPLLRLYLKEDNPRIIFDYKNRLEIDQELFEAMLDKFVQGNFNYLREMFGDLELRPEYVRSLHPDIQVTNLLANKEEGSEMVTWQSPSNESEHFVVDFTSKGTYFSQDS